MTYLRTKIVKHYNVGFVFRSLVFAIIFYLYLTQKDSFYELLRTPFLGPVSTLRILWAVFMVTMLSHLFPSDRKPMSLLKRKEETYREVKGYDELELLRYVQDQNKKAWYVMLSWLILNAVVGMLYLFNVIDNADLLMLTLFYYLCDYIRIIFYCPFQSKIMKNKCCVNCRIYDWGHFMMFTPMLFIKDFFSWSLFFTALIVLIHGEVVYAKYPERFYEGSNQVLQCHNCRDKTCQIKRKLEGRRPPEGD
ncbi:MAG: hypothetical protein Q4B67_08110 [Eubacteriales bacterium]|nr:hypothetical protein [Eubacteriales bacterium]